MLSQQVIHRVMSVSKWAMSLSLLGFVACILISYPYAELFSMATQISAHILTIIFAGVFKAAAVALMAANKELLKLQPYNNFEEYACCSLKY